MECPSFEVGEGVAVGVLAHVPVVHLEHVGRTATGDLGRQLLKYALNSRTSLHLDVEFFCSQKVDPPVGDLGPVGVPHQANRMVTGPSAGAWSVHTPDGATRSANQRGQGYARATTLGRPSGHATPSAYREALLKRFERAVEHGSIPGAPALSDESLRMQCDPCKRSAAASREVLSDRYRPRDGKALSAQCWTETFSSPCASDDRAAGRRRTGRREKRYDRARGAHYVMGVAGTVRQRGDVRPRRKVTGGSAAAAKKLHKYRR